MKKKILIILFVTSLFIMDLELAFAVTENYDPNTEINVSGIVIDVLKRQRGPQIFILKSMERLYHVITGPWWYLKRTGLNIKKDMAVEVTGSKVYDRKGTLYLIVYSIKDLDTGKIYMFRDDKLVPLWRRISYETQAYANICYSFHFYRYRYL